MINVLFVCLGNICRSPAAEAVFTVLVEKAGLSHAISCGSCGTGNYHIGEPSDTRMIRHAAARGYFIDHRGRQFREPDDFNRFPYIVTMDEQNRAEVLALAHTENQARRVVRMTDFCRRYPGVTEIPDPYSGGAAGFELVMDLLEDACAGLLAHLRQRHALD
jgi:protein-tyrosine phosphatase